MDYIDQRSESEQKRTRESKGKETMLPVLQSARAGLRLGSQSSLSSSGLGVSRSWALISRRSMFINTESTPNPHSFKFLPQREVLAAIHGTGVHISSTDKRETIARSPLVKKLFAEVKGIQSIFLGRDFITVTKDKDEPWIRLKPMVFSALLDFFAENTPVYLSEDESSTTPAVSDTTILDTDDEVVAAIKELIETRVRPSVQEDGGDIFYEGFDEKTGIVRVRLAGSCVGCPSSSVTLRNGVENMLMHYIPEVKGIEEVTATASEEEKEKMTPEQMQLKLQFRPEYYPPPKV